MLHYRRRVKEDKCVSFPPFYRTANEKIPRNETVEPVRTTGTHLPVLDPVLGNAVPNQQNTVVEVGSAAGRQDTSRVQLEAHLPRVQCERA